MKRDDEIVVASTSKSAHSEHGSNDLLFHNIMLNTILSSSFNSNLIPVPCRIENEINFIKPIEHNADQIFQENAIAEKSPVQFLKMAAQEYFNNLVFKTFF